jgi:hypothetical protein
MWKPEPVLFTLLAPVFYWLLVTVLTMELILIVSIL